jgi:hypothetical protein
VTGPNLSFGSSSLISLRKQSFSLSRARFRPPGNIHKRSRLRLTKITWPRFIATSFDDFAILTGCCTSRQPDVALKHISA